MTYGVYEPGEHEAKIKPHININGTGRKELYDQAADVRDCFNKTIEAMYLAMPHGHDYKSNEEAVQAREAHRCMIVELQKMHDHFYSLMVNALPGED